MSVESAKAFIERMKTDEDFAKVVNEAQDNKERMAIAQQAGFAFDAEEIKAASGALSEEELNTVVGGQYYCWGGALGHMR